MSILYAIRDAVEKETDLEKAKAIVLNHIAAQTPSKDFRRMSVQVKYQISTHARLVSWLYNNILAHEGLGTIGGKYVERS